VTSSSSVRVGAAVPPKSGCLRYWKACGRVSQLRCIIELAISSLVREPGGGLIVLPGAFTASHLEQIIELPARYGAQWPAYAF
jgi:hypothetical protein